MKHLIRTSHRPLWLIKGVLICAIALTLVAVQEQWFDSSKPTHVIDPKKKNDSARWLLPVIELIPSGPASELIQGLFRVSALASFLKAHMPYGATYENPVLTDEQAWDVAAFVNSMPRPHQEFPADWPDLKLKPVDHPFGPHDDGYSEKEHKYGPFGPIIESQKRR